MKQKRLSSLIGELSYILDELKKLTISSDKIQIACIWEDDMTYVHYWHPSNDEPLPVCSVLHKLEEKDLQRSLCNALNMLTMTSYKYGLEWIGDYPWKNLPEQFHKLALVLTAEEKQLTEEQRDYIKEEQYALHHLSSELQVQDTDRSSV